MKPTTRITVVALAACLAWPALADDELNLYEWAARAPIVVAVESMGESGKHVELRLEKIFRGDFQPGDRLAVDLKLANRSRDLLVDRTKLQLDQGQRFLVLLEEGSVREKDGTTVYHIVRGVHGARRLPEESEEVWFRAMDRFMAIQSMASESRAWRQFAAMLEETDPLLLEIALEEFLKFRRGDPELLLAVLPVLDHPSPLLREDATRLIDQILQYHPGEPIPEEEALRGELIARARRDESAAVRVAATEALANFPGEQVEAVLEQISGDDPDQSVRYAAELKLLERRQRREDRH